MRVILLIAVGIPLTQLSSNAQPTSRAASSDSPVVAALPIRGETVELDGRLDDPIWASAQSVTRFTQVVPNDGSEPTERTDVRFAYTRRALYIAARLYDSQPDSIVSRLSRRDADSSSDEFSVAIDSYLDRRTAFHFSVNPAGSRRDGISTDDTNLRDASWDPVWNVATRIDSFGWTAEFEIPFSQLRFDTGDDQTWGLNCSRLIFRKSESVIWSWHPNTTPGYTSLFGQLEGLQGLSAPKRIEILPYAVASSDHIEGANPENPFHDGSLQDVKAGLDVNIGITSDISVTATINPDFGQVEADPAVVNLTVFETFFDERRPFFVEDASLFRFGSLSAGAPNLFYSRRIGKSPSLAASSPGGFVSNPDATPILGAAKLSGKTGGWSIGLLDAVTGRETARIQTVNGERRTEPVEPLTNFSILSLRKDFRNGNSGIGALTTTVHRDLNEPIFQRLRSSAYAGGVDFFHRFAGNTYQIAGLVSGSLIRGSTDAMISAQRSSVRYFQRQDEDHTRVDSLATAISGYATSLQIEKIDGNWLGWAALITNSPGFDTNDAGYESAVDRIYSGLGGERRWLDPGRLFRRLRIAVSASLMWNYGGTVVRRNATVTTSGQLLSYWRFSLNGTYQDKILSDRATRGGPLMVSPAQLSVTGSIGSDVRRPIVNTTEMAITTDESGGWSSRVESEWTIRPSSRFSLQFVPSVQVSRSSAFYVTNRADRMALSTYGVRYVFGELDQTSLNMSIRLDVALTPDLSIQWWAQPFIARGDYSGFKELSEPRTFEFVQYGFDNGSFIVLDDETDLYSVDPDGSGAAGGFSFRNPDFRFRSLRSNLVFRWEYSPGSTLYLVWNHNRSGNARDPRFSLIDEVGNIFADDMQNTFLVKLNYWFSR